MGNKWTINNEENEFNLVPGDLLENWRTKDRCLVVNINPITNEAFIQTSHEGSFFVKAEKLNHFLRNCYKIGRVPT